MAENAPPESLLPLSERAKRGNLAVKLAKELGADIDQPDLRFGQMPIAEPRAPRVVDFG